MATISQPPPIPADVELGTKQKRALIERVAASDHIVRSARLHDFLLYVGGQSLKEGCPEIREQEIGAKVFGRPAAYDRSQDNIVRVNATELRKRIEHYFASEGANEPFVFEIPRGGYKLVFHPRVSNPIAEHFPVNAEKTSSSDLLALEARGNSARRRLSEFVWPALCLLLAVGCGLLAWQNRSLRKTFSPWNGQPALSAFWSGFLDPQKQTDIVLPDDSASVIEDITGQPISLDDYLTREYIRSTQNSALSADRKHDVLQIFSHNLVTFGGVRAAQLILGSIPSGYRHYLTLTRNFTADEMKRDNVVLVGGEKSVPWDHLFDNQIDFVTDYDYAHGVQFVRNRNPKPGEQITYSVVHGSDNLVGYAAIAYIPNPSATGHVIILAGTDSDATGAAAAFLTSEEHMVKLRDSLHANGDFPNFEVLLKTSRVSGTFFDAEPIAYRSYSASRVEQMHSEP